MKKFLFSAIAVALALGASAQKTTEDVRIYINPGHGAFDSGSRPMGTVKHGENNAYTDVNNDTTNFFESNTNLQKGLAMLEKLIEYGVPFDRTKNQENENPHRVGAALDLSQNIVMSRVKSGVAPAYTDYENHTTPPETDYYDRALSEIAAEVEFNNFDIFVSIHSNAATEGTNTNFPLLLYRGTDSEEGNVGSVAMSKACWPHLFKLGHQQWTSYSMTNMNVRGDISFYDGQSTVSYKVTDPNYQFDETDQFSEYVEATDTTPAYVKYTGYLGVIKHGVPGFLAEGYFHTYQPARHRYMNWEVCHLEGEAYAKGLNDYFGWGKTEDKATIYGIVRDKNNRFTHEFYNPNVSSNDKFLPLNEATVTLLKGEEVVATYTTDDEYNGAFIFNDVEPGTYKLNYSHPAYKAALEEYTAEFTVEAGDMYFPEAFLVDTAYVPPTIVYENYPDSTAGKNFNVFPNYEVKANEYAPLATLLEGKTVRRQIVRDDKLYVLALDEAKDPYIYLADLANDTVMTLDTKPVVMGGNGILKISDIALTADHVLVASGFSLNHYDDSYAEADGTERGSVHFYKWAQDSITTLPDTCELWFTSTFCCNFFRGKLGKTIAYSGTLEEGTITTTCPHGTHESDIAMRLAQFSIVKGQNTGAIRYDAWVALPNEANFYGDAMSDCDDYELMVSPLGEDNNFVLDGNLIAPFEWTSEGDGSEPQVLGRNENVSNVKAVGTNFFRYAGKPFMVTPKVNEEGKVCGIELFDISNGLSDAKAVELIGGDIEPVEYKYASAHGELALTLNAEDITTGADLEFFLVVDGKTYKFTETETYATFAPEDGGTANPFAYALKSERNDNIITINYALNADTEDVKVVVKNAEGEAVLTLEQGAQTKGAQTAQINIEESFEEDGQYTWEVVVDGADKTAVETFKSYMFYHPRGVEVDNNMESPSFGNIYCTEGMTSSNTQYHSNTTNSGGLGLYAFTADMEPIKNPATDNYGFKGGWDLSYKIGSSNAADLARVRLAEDGRLFVTRMTGLGNYIMFAPSFEDLLANNKFTSLFDGLTLDAETYKYTDANGNFMGAANLGFDVKGSGEDLKLLALSSNSNHWSYVYSGGSTDEYALGTAATLPVPTNIPALTGKYTIAPQVTNVEYDDRGGIWYCQYRGTPTDAQPGLVYIDSTGTEKYKDLVSRGGGGVRLSPDGKQIAIASTGANPKQFTVYNLVWSEDGVPALRREYVITHNIGTNVYDIAWDLAGNIYICGNSGEYLKGFALPRTDAFTTKAASQYAFSLEGVGINAVSIENNANAPVEYYNLQGVKVANPSNGVYIKVQGKKATKVYVK